MKEQLYRSVFESRYSSREMLEIFSESRKFTTWRHLWLELASIEKELGLSITDEQLNEMRQHLEDIDFDKAAAYEKKFRHDVMAHVHTFGDAAPSAAGIIHLGATSMFVSDNGDLIQFRDALKLIRSKLLRLLKQLGTFADQYKDLPTLGFTHMQPAQLTTVGKRAALWLFDFYLDFQETERLIRELPMRGVKGTTGTQASFMELFHDDQEKVMALDRKLAERFGFKETLPLSGQTYTRKIDSSILDNLRHLAESSHKMTNDIRILQHLKELEEPFGANQIGSSAMAYKRNPMRSERVSSLSKFLISLSMNGPLVSSTQWFERTLDDSADRRLALSEAFLAADAILEILLNITNGLVVNKAMIQKHIDENLPYMITENLLMEAVKQGGDRQELHEVIRVHSMESQKLIKQGLQNDMIERLLEDPRIPLKREDLDKVLDARLYTGRAAGQVSEFLTTAIDPLEEISFSSEEDLRV